MDKVLQAYGYAALAKDASGRYMNVKRTLRNYEDIMEVARGDDMKGTFQEQIVAAIKDALTKDANALAETNDFKVDEKTTLHTQPAKPKPDQQYVTKKQFFDFRSDIMAEFKKLAPPPAAP